MALIDKIEVAEAIRCLPNGFKIPDLPNLLVITGKNNSGKTTFMKSIAPKDKGGWGKGSFYNTAGEQIEVEVIFIAAENIQPANDAAKPKTKSALVLTLTDIFTTLKIDSELAKKKEIFDEIKKITDEANKNLKSFTGSDDHQINQDERKLEAKDIAELLISRMYANEGDDPRELSELGQGTQRLIIAALLKAYAENPNRKAGATEKPLLLLFEEPEIYLHPGLKKKLNAALVEIASKDNHQVIISTHDPYFAYTNMYQDDDSGVISFIKDNDGNTEFKKGDNFTGIEDELLHIYLFTKVMGKLCPGGTATYVGSKINDELKKICPKEDIVEYHYGKDDKEGGDFALPVYVRHRIHHPPKDKVEIPADQLERSIEILSGILNKED